MSEGIQATSANSASGLAFDAPPARRKMRWLLFGPLVGVVAVFVAFYFLMWRDPHLVPSPLIGKPVPTFSLPPVQGRSLGLSSADLHGQVSLVNAFASWCVACRAEHPLLMQLKAQGTVPIHGLNYKDAPADASHWLDTMGDPYTRTGADRDGRVAIDWGLYGVPETFVVGADGRIAYKQIGALTPDILDKIILPLVRRLREKPPGQTP